jgi:hypothetical protein
VMYFVVQGLREKVKGTASDPAATQVRPQSPASP